MHKPDRIMFVTARSAATSAEYEVRSLGGAQLKKKFDLPVRDVLGSQEGKAQEHDHLARAASGQGDERAPARMLNLRGMRSSPCFAR
jgi:hypothetical protein